MSHSVYSKTIFGLVFFKKFKALRKIVLNIVPSSLIEYVDKYSIDKL